MGVYLQKKIQNKLEEKNLTINALEKQAGLKRSAARNIMQGYSNKPSAETLKAIANVLGCTVDDLMGPNDSSLTDIPLKTVTHPWNEKLYLNTINAVLKNLKDEKLDLKFEHVTALIDEVYMYSLSKKTDKVDQDFVDWIINKRFYEK